MRMKKAQFFCIFFSFLKMEFHKHSLRPSVIHDVLIISDKLTFEIIYGYSGQKKPNVTELYYFILLLQLKFH